MNRYLLLFLLSLPAMAAEQAFPQSPVGQPEIKTLPAGVLLRSAAAGDYFKQANRLFRPLFGYISTHDISMTVPVEAQIDSAAMYFWVAPSQLAKVAGNADGVEVVKVPERRVASLGARGGYSPENFSKTRDELLVWLSRQPGVEAAGPAYAVYWNGPFLPGFLKRYEVHIPLRPKAA